MTTTTSNQALDLDSFDSMPTGELYLKTPLGGLKTSTYITLAAPDNPVRQALDLAANQRLSDAFANFGKAPVLDPAADYDNDTDYLVAATLGWNLRKGGQDLPFDAATARSIYSDPKKAWLRKQAIAGLKNQEVFIVASASV